MNPTSRPAKRRGSVAQRRRGDNRGDNRRTITPEAKADCDRLKHLLDATNARLTANGEEPITEGTFVRQSQGTIKRQAIWAMVNGRRGLTMEMKLDSAVVLKTKPQNIFTKTWRWSLLTRLAPDERLPLAEAVLSDLAEPERTEALRVLDAYARAGRNKKREIMRAIRIIVGDDGSAGAAVEG